MNKKIMKMITSDWVQFSPLTCKVIVQCSWLLPVVDGDASLVRAALGLRGALPVLGLESRPVANLPLQLLVDVVGQAVRSS